MGGKERARLALVVLTSLSLALPPYAAHAEELEVVEGGADDAAVIEDGRVAAGAADDMVTVLDGAASASGAEPGADAPATDDGVAGERVEYLDADGNTAYTDGEYTLFKQVKDEKDVTLKGGWYVVGKGDTTFENRLNVNGDVNIILCDGSILTCKDGIHVTDGSKLTVWGQGEGDGRLVATAGKKNKGAAIGSDEKEKAYAGTICIYGGVIDATSGDCAAAIGGGDKSSSGAITIGGTKTVVNATAADHAAAIGGGRDGKADSITIEGGTVTAKGGNYAAGIGGGGDAGADHIDITGGKVVAWGGKESAAIGSANKGRVGTIKICGGDITAIGSSKAAGIGGGDGASSKGGGYDAISISGDRTRVRSYGGDEAAGIGSGNEGNDSPGSITISGGANVTAIGGTKNAALANDGDVTYEAADYGAGIGGGDNCPSGTITISGDKTVVYAEGADHGAGIGGGDGKRGDSITIKGGTITAKGGDYAAGIGGGGDSGVESIAITGGKVTAWGGKESAGIGSANKGKAKRIEIGGGDIVAVGAANAAGIGGGDGNEKHGSYDAISISGDTTRIRAYGGNQAAGIGTGNDCGSNKGTITISGGADVEAVGGTKDVVIDDADNVRFTHEGCDSGAGVGGGDTSDAGTILIYGADTNVHAEGSDEAAGIGSGDEGDSAGTISIFAGAHVFAQGGRLAAGIGGGDNCTGAKVTISNQNTVVEAKGGSEAAGIGGGQGKAGKDVVIESDAKVTAEAGDGAAPIGAGKGSKKHKGLELYLNAQVVIRDGEQIVQSCDRLSACHEAANGRVTIQPSDHAHEAGAFERIDLATDGTLGLTFWVRLPDGADPETSSMEFSIRGKAGRTVKVDCAQATRNEKGLYGFTFELSALELAEPVRATFHYGENKAIEAGSSLRQRIIVANRARRRDPGAFSEAEWNFMWATANYGHFVQPWLASSNGWKVGRDFARMDLCMPGMNDVRAAKDAVSAYKSASCIEGSGVKKVVTSVALGSRAECRIRLVPDEGKSLKASARFRGSTYEARRQGDGSYLIKVPGIMTGDFGEEIEISGTCDTDFSARLSVLSYVNARLSEPKASDESLNAVTALYNYYKSVMECEAK